MTDDIDLQQIIQQAAEEMYFRDYAERELRARDEVELSSIGASKKSFVEFSIIYDIDNASEINKIYDPGSLKCIICPEKRSCGFINYIANEANKEYITIKDSRRFYKN